MRESSCDQGGRYWSSTSCTIWSHSSITLYWTSWLQSTMDSSGLLLFFLHYFYFHSHLFSFVVSHMWETKIYGIISHAFSFSCWVFPLTTAWRVPKGSSKRQWRWNKWCWVCDYGKGGVVGCRSPIFLLSHFAPPLLSQVGLQRCSESGLFLLRTWRACVVFLVM